MIRKLIITLIFVLLGCSISFADEANYEISEVYWDEGESDIYASWEKAESSTKYVAALYYKEITEKNKLSESSVSTDQKNFTSQILKKGRGTYYFTVYPVKGGTEYLVTSEALELDKEDIVNLREAHNKSKVSRKAEVGQSYNGLPYVLDSNCKWVSFPRGMWKYQVGEGIYAGKTWLDLDGKTYYLDKQEYMAKGWTVIDERWYYFNMDGSLVKNGTTPDGYSVNETGIWVRDGKEIKAKETEDSSARSVDAKAVKKITLQMKTGSKKKDVDADSISLSANDSKVIDVDFDIPYEQWSAGQSVIAKVRLQANKNRFYEDDAHYVVSGGEVVDHMGTDKQQTVFIRFTTQTTLDTPGKLQLDGTMLTWNPVNHAVKYRVNIEVPYQFMRTIDVTDAFADLHEYIDGTESGTTIQVQACAPDDPNYIDSHFSGKFKIK